MDSKWESQHSQMRKLLESLRQHERVTFRSEAVPILLSDFLSGVYQHFVAERLALSTVFESDEERAAYDDHYQTVLEEISEIQCGLIKHQDMTVASVLPRMERWISAHESLHSHQRLLHPVVGDFHGDR